MRKNITLLFCGLIVAGSLSLTSCASMFGKSSYPLYISSDPKGADVEIFNQSGKRVYSGQSPASVSLKTSNGYMKSASYDVKISYPGYKTQDIQVTSKINGWYWANIALGGLIGMLIVDPLTGAMYKLNNKSIDVVLEKSMNDADLSKNELKIIDIKDVPENLKEYLVKLN